MPEIDDTNKPSPGESVESPFVQWVREVYGRFEQERKPLEEDWDLAEDAWRGKYSESNLKKWRQLEGSAWRSQVFVRITRRKVMGAVSQINDVLLQGGGSLPFAIKATPVPDMDKKEADKRAGLMQQKIKDVLVECKYDRVLMESVLSAAIYGMCVQKSPVIRSQKKIRYQYVIPMPGSIPNMAVPPALGRRFGRYEQKIENILIPKVENVPVHDIFWDLEASHPQEGLAIIERQKMSPDRLWSMTQKRRGKKGGWDIEAVKKVIDKAKGSETLADDNESPHKLRLSKRRESISVLMYWGLAPNSILTGKGSNFDLDISEEHEMTEVFGIVADDMVVYKPIPNPLAGGYRPYHFAFWEKNPNESTGVGIPENIRDAQMMINSGVRCFIDNKALSGNVLGAINAGQMKAGSSMSVYPGKIFQFKSGVGRVADHMNWFSPPDVGRGLLELVGLFERFADEESGIPKLLQGETSQHQPETAYATSRLIEAGNKQLGNVIRNLDEGVIEPVVESLYHYLMATDQDESIKGDYKIEAQGFSSYTDRVTQGNNLTEFMMLMMSNPITARLLKPAPIAREIASIRDLDQELYVKTDDELQAEAAELKREMVLAALQAQGINPAQGGGGGPQLPGGISKRPAQPPRYGGNHGA